MRFFTNAIMQFHNRMGLDVSNTPRLLPCNATNAKLFADRLLDMAREAATTSQGTDDLLLSRTALALEEMAEWLLAHAAGDLVAAADAWGDRCYVLLGDAVSAGLPTYGLLVAIHRSNMTKTADPAGGKPTKGEDYVAPDIKGALQRMWRR